MDALARLLPPRDTPAGHLIRLSRPRFWSYLAGPVVVGLAWGAGAPADLLALSSLALLAYFLVPANVYLYGVNDRFDADVDAQNPKKDGPEVRYRGGRVTPVAVVLSGLAGLGLLALVPPRAGVAVVGFLALGAAYSAPPLRLKTTPLLDSVSNGLYVLPGVAAFVAASGAWPPLPAVVGAWLWAMAMHTVSAVPDVEPDRRAGIRTTATVLGRRGALAYCAVVWAAAAVAFGLLDPLLGVLLAPYPVLVLAIDRTAVPVDRAYWWFPAINTALGAVLTVGGLWVMVGG